MGKFDTLKDAQANGVNYDVMTEDIIAKLEEWDAQFGVEISNVAHDAVNVKFTKVPDDVPKIANEVYELCPDIIEQHYGCMDDMMDAMEGFGQEIDPKLKALVDGIDFNDDEFGMQILQKAIREGHVLPLWWD